MRRTRRRRARERSAPGHPLAAADVGHLASATRPTLLAATRLSRGGRDEVPPLRHAVCGLTLLIDLGSAPPSNAYPDAQALNAPGNWFPLRVLAAHECWLVQTRGLRPRTPLFSDDYAYFSSLLAVRGWRTRSATSSHVAALRRSAPRSRVVEVAANDGYLLQYSAQRGIPLPGHRADGQHGAGRARAKGIEHRRRVLRRRLRERLRRRRLGRRSDGGQQRAGPRARHQRLRRRLRASCSSPRACATFEFPHLTAAGRRLPVRHDLPRALFLPVAPLRSASSSATGWRCSTSKSCPPTAAACASMRSAQDSGQRPCDRAG